MTLDEYLRWCGTVDEAVLTITKETCDLCVTILKVKSAKHVHEKIRVNNYDTDYTSGVCWNLEEMTKEIDAEIQERLLPKNGARECPP